MGTSEMKRCELCKAKARVHCESDRASLCWDCDAKVHSANFLVARHSRNLLCRVCQTPTPWFAAGAKLGATVSICEECVDREECDDSGGEESAEEVVEESQIVPWSPPPPEESSSSIEEAVSGGDEFVSRKRSRIENDSSNFQSEASSHLNICYPTPSDTAVVEAVTFSKRKRTPPPPRKIHTTESDPVSGCGSGILGTLQREDTDPGEEMSEFCSSSRRSDFPPHT